MKLILALILASAAVAPGRLAIAFHSDTATAAAMTTRPAGTVVDTAAGVWNNLTSAVGAAPVLSGVVLKDAAGGDSGARLAAASGYVGGNALPWSSNSQDWVMMNGWYGFRNTESVTVTNLPAAYTAGFSVIVYGDSNNTNRTMNYTIGGQAKVIQDNATFAGTFTAGANFVVFQGLTGNSFTLTGNPGATDARSAVNGLIIVPGNLPQPPAITSFSANDHYVAPGTAVTLSWNVTGAETLTLAPGIGPVSGPAGTTTVTVNETTTFTLTATNGAGQRAATLRVGAGPPRPNLVFFLVDDMGWQDTSEPFYYDSSGNPVVTPLNQRYRTPNMEALADKGMKFTNAYSMPVCTPSRVCWMTGLNSARHHVTNWTSTTGADTDQNTTTSHNSPAAWNRTGLPAGFPTLPALLQAAGYRTLHAGKAHFGATPYAKDPLNVGFDVNIAGSEIGHPASYFAKDDFGTGSNHVTGLEQYHDTDLFLTEALTLEMNQAIERAVADGTPFFAYLAHYAVHSPFQTDPRFAANYPGLSGSLLAFATLIEGMDKSLGDLLAKLDQLGVADDTLVVFMSDNGGDAPFADVNDSNAPLRHKKGSKYEGGIREPMIVSWAKRDAANLFQAALPIPAGSREDDLVAIFDFFPTFAAVAGVPVTGAIDGHDLTPYLRAVPGTHRPQELLIHFPHDHRSAYFTILREGDWKLIYNYAANSHELYHLATDLSERNDLAASEPERVMAMARTMARRLAAAGAQWPTFAAGGADDPLAMPVLPGVDLDHDGIPDNTEDPNGNGLRDPGETAPDNDNSDGDPTRDGDELRTGTNPLDGASFFRAIPGTAGGNRVLSWPSSPASRYRVESSSSLMPGEWEVFADNIPGAAGITTIELGPVSGPLEGFYRVGLK
jgi:arylsulfatase A-like enzyme